MNTPSRVDLTELIGHHVLDRNGESVGRLECLWPDHNSKTAFLGVHTGWFMGRTHVVPIYGTEVSAASRIIRLGYDEEQIRRAPTLNAGEELDEGMEREVCRFYGIAWEPREPARGPVTPQQEAHVQLHKEEVKVGKRQVVYGGVRVRKIIRTEIVHVPVELQREEIVIERVPATEAGATMPATLMQGSDVASPGTHASTAPGEQEIFIPLYREEPIIEKQNRVTEEVHLRKETKVERQTVSEQVRKEEVQIERGPARKRGRARKRGHAPFAPRNNSRSARATRWTLFCLVKTRAQAASIAEELRAENYADFSAMFADKDGTNDPARERFPGAHQTKTDGTIAGDALAWIAEANGLAIPGFGPLIARGPVLMALGDETSDGPAHGVSAALISFGLPQDDAARYERRMREGDVVLSVHSDSEQEIQHGKEIFEHHHAEQITLAEASRDAI